MTSDSHLLLPISLIIISKRMFSFIILFIYDLNFSFLLNMTSRYFIFSTNLIIISSKLNVIVVSIYLFLMKCINIYFDLSNYISYLTLHYFIFMSIYVNLSIFSSVFDSIMSYSISSINLISMSFSLMISRASAL